MDIDRMKMERICHACFRITANGKVFYIDPFGIEEKEPVKADVILITHEHHDHLSLDDIAKIFKEDTTIVICPLSHPPLLQLDRDIFNLVVMGPQEKYIGDGFEVETILAYNVNKFRSPGIPFHPKDDERVGFILTTDEKRIYHAGDTDFIPEMEGLKDIDIALLPVSGMYVMTSEEAARAADTIKPKVAIPMHYGKIVGSQKDAEEFKKRTTVNVVVL